MSFATTDQLRIRLRLTTLTTAQTEQAEQLLEQATGAIAAACDKTDTWSDALDPVPSALAGMCLDVAARGFNATPGLRSEQETLGAYSHSVSFPDHAATGVQLTEEEELRARRIVYGSNTASATGESIADTLAETYFNDGAS